MTTSRSLLHHQATFLYTKILFNGNNSEKLKKRIVRKRMRIDQFKRFFNMHWLIMN